MAEIRVSEHALAQAGRRGLSLRSIPDVAEKPEQSVSVGAGREIRQSLIEDRAFGLRFLLRVIVDTSSGVPMVIAAYRTSRIAKYWSHR